MPLIKTTHQPQLYSTPLTIISLQILTIRHQPTTEDLNLMAGVVVVILEAVAGVIALEEEADGAELVAQAAISPLLDTIVTTAGGLGTLGLERIHTNDPTSMMLGSFPLQPTFGPTQTYSTTGPLTFSNLHGPILF